MTVIIILSVLAGYYLGVYFAYKIGHRKGFLDGYREGNLQGGKDFADLFLKKIGAINDT